MRGELKKSSTDHLRCLRATSPAVGPFILRRSDRRTLAISVLPDGRIEVVAPRDCARAIIEERLRKRVGWIERQRRSFLMLAPTGVPRRFVTGATHRYLGRQYRLKIAKGDRNTVRLHGAELVVETPSPGPRSVAILVRRWFRARAAEQFALRIGAWEAWSRARRLPRPRLVLRAMRTRWGSACPDGRILLNPDLVRAPSPCIDYVIAHEMCHLREPDHGRAFLALLSAVCPGWRRAKLRLETMDRV